MFVADVKQTNAGLRRWTITTRTRLLLDGRSTAYQRSLRSHWRNISMVVNPLVSVTLTYLFIQASMQQITHRCTYGRNVGRRMVVMVVHVKVGVIERTDKTWLSRLSRYPAWKRCGSNLSILQLAWSPTEKSVVWTGLRIAKMEDIMHRSLIVWLVT